MLEWKEQFSKIILNRGETYFLQKRVKNLTKLYSLCRRGTRL